MNIKLNNKLEDKFFPILFPLKKEVTFRMVIKFEKKIEKSKKTDLILNILEIILQCGLDKIVSEFFEYHDNQMFYENKWNKKKISQYFIENLLSNPIEDLSIEPDLKLKEIERSTGFRVSDFVKVKYTIKRVLEYLSKYLNNRIQIISIKRCIINYARINDYINVKRKLRDFYHHIIMPEDD